MRLEASPFTSPAEATELPNGAGWFDSAVQAAVVMGRKNLKKLVQAGGEHAAPAHTGRAGLTPGWPGRQRNSR